MHKRYPGQSYLYDFYLPEHNMYIEYCGMPTSTYDNKKRKLVEFDVLWSREAEGIIESIDKLTLN